MKRILAAILAAMLLMSTAVACTNNDKDKDDDKKDDQKQDDLNDNQDDKKDDKEDDQKNDDQNNDDQNNDDQNNDDQNNGDVELAYGSALEIMETVWNAISDDDKFYVAGGDYDNIVENGPGKFNLTGEEAATSLRGMTWYPEADFAKLDDAATMIHGMMLNNFCAATYHFTSSADATAMIDTLKDTLLNAHYMCGQPEKIAILTVPGDYLIVMFGLGEGCVDLFASTAVSVIDGAAIVVDQGIW